MNVASRLPNSSVAALADRAASAAKPPFLGFGLGLRHQHYDEILDGNPPIDWFEVISENYMLPGGQPLRVLDQIPVAQNDAIKIELQGRTAPTRRDVEDKRGVMAWDMALTPDEEKAVEFGYRVTWPGAKRVIYGAGL